MALSPWPGTHECSHGGLGENGGYLCCYARRGTRETQTDRRLCLCECSCRDGLDTRAVNHIGGLCGRPDTTASAYT